MDEGRTMDFAKELRRFEVVPMCARLGRMLDGMEWV